MSNKNSLKELIISEFSNRLTIESYIKNINIGLWNSEKKLISKYFKKQVSILDIGCGVGRTTIPLFLSSYNVIGIDITPAMIKSAKQIAKERKLRIKYEIQDATNLKFKSKTFDNALFSANGWTQIPGRENRLVALKEIYRILKPGGYLIFTANIRSYIGKYSLVWIKEAIKHHILIHFGWNAKGLCFGDIFFSRSANSHYQKRQYINIPSINEVKKIISETPFKLVFYEYRNNIAPEDTNLKTGNCMFFVCKK